MKTKTESYESVMFEGMRKVTIFIIDIRIRNKQVPTDIKGTFAGKCQFGHHEFKNF